MQKRQAQLEQLVTGTQKDLPVTSAIDVDGQKLTQADIVAKLQGWIQLFQQVDATKAPARSAQQALQTAEPQMHHFVVTYGQALRHVFGKSNALLADFGLATVQPKTPSPETVVLAVAKRAATRKARQTMGRVQRKAVKGLPVTEVTVGPSGTQLAAPTAEPETAPVAGSAGK